MSHNKTNYSDILNNISFILLLPYFRFYFTSLLRVTRHPSLITRHMLQSILIELKINCVNGIEVLYAEHVLKFPR